MPVLIAQFTEEMIPIVAILMVFGIPIIALLTHHQRKMAELIHSRGQDLNPVVMDEVQRLRAEVQQMRRELHETTIALDDVRKLAPRGIEQRIGGSE
jgi:hypothetical protein